MCGIFGALVTKSNNIPQKDLYKLALQSTQRGKDGSGLFFCENKTYKIIRSNHKITKIIKHIDSPSINFAFGHCRLVTNGILDNQPILKDNICVIHNGIIVNTEYLWNSIKAKRELEIDTEIINGFILEKIKEGKELKNIAGKILEEFKGVVSSAIAIPSLGKLLLISNNGSLFWGKKGDTIFFSSEQYPLKNIDCQEIKQIKNSYKILDIFQSEDINSIDEKINSKSNLIPNLYLNNNDEQKILKYRTHSLKRCSKCVLPETMPFINFDSQGICNYCKNYKLRNQPKPIENLERIISKYDLNKENNCIVPFSGGRDSCYGLHLIVKNLNLKPITYTYDWGMVTDLGRRNISRMCSILNIENIIIAADIRKKRRNIANNFKAWLKSPDLGMVSILTAGDKHFFRHVETVKKQTGINLNIWSVNPLEVTYFKSGFLGIAPDFEEKLVYSNGALKQIRYQYLRLKKMMRSPGYFNKSLFDTLSGEYYRSFTKKNDYYHLFDFWRWDENEINDTLINSYDWEIAKDTKTTWRIGDGTAAIYNYIYYTIGGFTEHDTFRSNQIREGQITREEGLKLVLEENQPRYPNIKWYTDCLGMDFKSVISRINQIKPLYD